MTTSGVSAAVRTTGAASTAETLAPASSWTAFSFTFAGPASCPGPVSMTLGGGEADGAVYFDDVALTSPSVSSGGNELGNPAFTNLTVAWPSWGGGPLLTQTTAHSGKSSLLTPAGAWLGQTVTGLTPNLSYTVAAYLSGGQGTLTAGSASTTVTASGGWTPISVTAQASSTGTLAIAALSSGSATVYWDDFSMNGSAAPGGQQFGYDGFGNLLSQTPIFGTAPMMSLSVNPNTNQVTSGGTVYDGAGNMTQNGSGTAIAFDEMNRMTSHQSAQYIQEYSYSPGENKRMVVYSTGAPGSLSLYLYGPSGRILSSIGYQQSGSTWVAQGGGQTNYFYLGGKALNYAENNIGSTASSTFWPYGQANTGGGGVFGTYLGDPSGFYYADQRYYDQAWGRFVTADPSNANIDRSSSITWNKYAYTNGDPVNGSDPRGLYQDLNDYACWWVPDVMLGDDDYENSFFSVSRTENSGAISGPYAGLFSGPDSVGSMLNALSVGGFIYGEAGGQVNTSVGSVGAQINAIGSYDSSSGGDFSMSLTAGPGTPMLASPEAPNPGPITGWSLNSATTGPSLPSGGFEYSPINDDLQGAMFFPIYGAAGVFANSCGLVGVYAGGPPSGPTSSAVSGSLAAGGGVYLNLGCH